jgi:cell division protein FtsX
VPPLRAASILLDPGGVRTGLAVGLLGFALFAGLAWLSRPLAAWVDRRMPWERIGDPELRELLRITLAAGLLFLPAGVLSIGLAIAALDHALGAVTRW